MPIRPENKALYPPDWPAVRVRILERDGHCCKQCGVPDRAIGWRDDKGEFHIVARDGNRQRLADEQFTFGDVRKLILIVLTIAHLHDPNPANCDDANLGALCQRCHNILDMPMRQANAAASRRAPKADGDLFTCKTTTSATPSASG